MLPPVIEKARKILLYEQRMGHTDQAVRPGGLEAFVARWAEEVSELRLAGELKETDGARHPPIPIEQMIQQLLRGYHALDPMQRAAQVRAALAWLAGEEMPGRPDGKLDENTQVTGRKHTSGDIPASLPAHTVTGLHAAAHSATHMARLLPEALPGGNKRVAASQAGAAKELQVGGAGTMFEDMPLERPAPPVIRGNRLLVLSNQLDLPASGSGVDEDEAKSWQDDGYAAVDRHFLLQSRVTTIPGIGPSQEAKLQRLGIYTVQDLLFYFPREHHDYSKLEKIALIPLEQVVTIMGMIWEVENVRSASGRIRTIARISDETGQVRAIWFNQPYLLKQLTRGSYIVLTGTKQRFGNRVEFHVRSHELPEQGDLVNTGRLVPVYHLTEGLHPKALRRYTKWAVDRCAELVPEFLPSSIRSRVGLMALPQAISQYHYPEDEARLVRARQRLAFDELFLIQLGMLARRAEWSASAEGVALNIDLSQVFEQVEPEETAFVAERAANVTSLDEKSASPSKAAASSVLFPTHDGAVRSGLWQMSIDKPFEAVLPFKFTRAQRRVIREILADMARPQPMCRLLQGDVGSGKTVVATAGLLMAAVNGLQGVLMAPTEVLAEQHYRTISRLLEPFGIRVALLTGSQRSRERTNALAAVQSGEALVTVGTHALIQEGVSFARLGLVVVDEQHRFGVEQRDALRQKGYNPHMLVMTATPIPRTLALTLYGDLDVSTLDEMPAGRQQIITRWRSGTRRAEAYRMIAEQVAQGRQAYVICPLIEESETLEAKAAVREYERLRTQVFPNLRLGLVHGGLKSSEKEQVMRRFRDGELDVLVATAVVEVGVDVPNATVMVIEDADRFGLSQLHQFRGRVGRGTHQSYCYVLSEGSGPQAQERLSIIERTNNGFELAEEDLKLRGPGDFFGTRQSGIPELRVATLADTRLLEEARKQAEWLWATDPYLQKPEHRLLRERVATFWQLFIGH